MRILIIIVCLFIGGPVNAQFKLTNPILAGFYPDPGIIKAGIDYYLVNSTFSYFPGIPVFHSRDLQNWKQIGNVISRPSQMDFIGEEVSRGLFAPSINYHRGTFYVTCTDIDHQGNFVVTSKDPAGPWSDPVLLPEVRGIDPSLFFDDEKAYIVYNSDAPDNKPLYNGHRSIRMFEFDAENLKVKGSEHLLVNGGTDLSRKPVWIEGPHIYKRGEYYYLMAAEGGTSVNHSEVVFRSTSILGPYQPYEKNPILTQRDLHPNRKDPVTSTGHADLVEGPDGNTYAVFLATRPYRADFYNTGRETFIAPVTWTNGWPVINAGYNEVQYNYPVSFREVKQNELPLSGSFRYRLDFKDSLPPRLLFLRTKDTSWYDLITNRNALTMKLLPETCMGTGNPAFIGHRQQHLTCEVSTEMFFSAKTENEKSGLLIFQNQFHFYYICKSVKNNKGIIQLYRGNPQTKQMELVSERGMNVQQDKVYLKINARGDKYSFWYTFKPGRWEPLKTDLDGTYLSTRVAGGFVGSLFALYATSSGMPASNSAVFRWLEYNGNDSVY